MAQLGCACTLALWGVFFDICHCGRMPTRLAGALLWAGSPPVSAVPNHEALIGFLDLPHCWVLHFVFLMLFCLSFLPALVLALNSLFSSSELSANSSSSYSSTVTQLCSLLSAILIFFWRISISFSPSFRSVWAFSTGTIMRYWHHYTYCSSKLSSTHCTDWSIYLVGWRQVS